MIHLSETTLRLTRDLVTFTCGLLQASFAVPIKSSWFPALRVGNFQLPEPVFQVLEFLFEVLRKVKVIAGAVYENLNVQSAQLLDPLISEFRAKYPESGRYIGESLADRLILLFWLIFFAKIVISFLVWPFTSRSARPRKRTGRGFMIDSRLPGKTDPHPLSPLSEPTTPPSSILRKEVPKTMRKRIVVAK